MSLCHQFEEWARAKAGFNVIFSRLRHYNVHEQATRVFEHNLSLYYPLFAQAAVRSSKDSLLAANLVALVTSQLDSEGEQIVKSILYACKSQVSAFGGSLDNSQPILILAHLLVLKTIDAWPLYQLLVCLCRDKKFKLVSSVLGICGSELKAASHDSYTHIQSQIGSVAEQHPALDIVLDRYKRLVRGDIESVQELAAEFTQLKACDWEPSRTLILGEESESESESESGESEHNSPESTPAQATHAPPAAHAPPAPQLSASDIQLQKTIYLTIMSSISSKEACHKLVALGNRPLVVKMLIEACKQEKVYNKNFGTIGHGLCNVGSQWRQELASSFEHQYVAVEELNTREIRHLGTLYGWLVSTKSIPWSILAIARLTPEQSTPSTRIFLQAIFEEMRREAGLAEMKTRLKQFEGLFPRDIAGLRFSINFFTAIKMGPLTDESRVELKRLEAVI